MTLLLSVVGAGCTGQPAAVAPARVVSVTPTVTASVTHRTSISDPAVYRAATTWAGRTLKTSALSWWSAPVDVDGSSALTVADPVDDSTNVYIQPSVAVNPASTREQPDSAGGQLWSGGGLVSRTNGQLVALDSDHYYTCSATVVHSPRGNMVLTAGHCVWHIPLVKPHAAGGAAMTPLDQIWFIPAASQLRQPLVVDDSGYPEVVAPYGIWRVTKVSSSDEWMQNTWETRGTIGNETVAATHGSWSQDDVAFLTVESHDGQQIESVTGGQGLMFSDPMYFDQFHPYPTVILGYPDIKPFDGTAERFCIDGAPEPHTDRDPILVLVGLTTQVNCSMTAGASGGAWFTGFDQAAKAGYVYAVTSKGGDSLLTSAVLSLYVDYPLYHRLAGS